MYERFTDRARRAMQLATQEAWRVNHNYIGTEHILVGVVKLGAGAAAVLRGINETHPEQAIRVVRSFLECGPPPFIEGQKLPLTPRAREVVELAMKSATDMGLEWVGDEHLLIGLATEPEGCASQALRSLGLDTAIVDTAARQFLKPHPDRTIASRGDQAKEGSSDLSFTTSADRMQSAMSGQLGALLGLDSPHVAPACERCRFWVVGSDGEMGNCRRWPPQLIRYEGADAECDGIRDEMSDFACFPSTTRDSWCGEFKEKP